MRNQYKILAEKYHTICEDEDVKLGASRPFNNFSYDESEFNLIKEIQDWPHAKKFVEWLVNKSKWDEDMAEYAADNDITNEVELACQFFDNMAENYSDGGYTKKVFDEIILGMLSDLYEDFIKIWWPQEQKRLAALNKDNPGIEMDI